MAQNSASAPSVNASAPLATKPRPRLLTPAELRESATVPGELRPRGEGTTPQLSVPLVKSPAVAPKPRVVRPGKTAASGGINDAVARCEAQSDEQVRAKCRADLARQGRSR
jgi:hypothetical protein